MISQEWKDLVRSFPLFEVGDRHGEERGGGCVTVCVKGLLLPVQNIPVFVVVGNSGEAVWVEVTGPY